MANAVLSFPNQVDATFYNVVACGGDWEVANPLTNMKSRLLTKVARSSDATEASTQFHVDLGAPRGIRYIAVPRHSMDRAAQYRIRGSNTIKWRQVVVDGNQNASDTTLDVEAGPLGATIEAGDYFTLDGNTYKVTIGDTISSNSTGTITISPGLVDDVDDDDPLTCNVGDYTTPLKEIGWKDVWPVIYPLGTIPLESASGWNGKITEEDAASGVVMPIVEGFNQVICQYWHYEFSNTSNPADYIDISRLFMSAGWQFSLNIDYGFAMGYQTDTSVDTSLGGARWYDVRDGRRVARFTVSLLPVNEALVNGLEMQRRLGIHQQAFFIFDPDDTANMHRRAFLVTLRQLSQIEYPVFDRNTLAFEIEEVIQ